MHAGAILSRFKQRLDASAEEWIGLTFPPAQRAIADAEWTPDTSDAYCHRCGDSVAKGEATAGGCTTCRTGGELAGGIGTGVIRLGPYFDELDDWVRAIKYHCWSEMGEELGRQLASSVRQSGLVDVSRSIVVPLPMPWQRRVYRGIDHTAVIARAMAMQLQRPMVKMLAKSMQPPQVSLPPSARKRAGARGLRVRRRWGGWPVRDVQIILVDDVRTTGATLRAAVRMLKALKPEKIVCAVLAVSDSTARRRRAELTHISNSEAERNGTVITTL